MGLASIGGSTGTMILPFFTSWCIDVYGWRGAFILLGGLCLQGVVPGVLFYSAKTKLSTSPGQKTGMYSETCVKRPQVEINELYRKIVNIFSYPSMLTVWVLRRTI